MTILSVVLAVRGLRLQAWLSPSIRLIVMGKLDFHVQSVGSPWSLAESAAYAGILQGMDSPTEWGQGAGAYGKRFASTLGCSAIHAVLAFGLDSTLHQDPRYFRSRNTGFWRRTAHALRGTILTRTDSGGETLSTWRLGSALRRRLSFEPVVSGPAEYRAPRRHAGIPPPRVRFRQQSRLPNSGRISNGRYCAENHNRLQ